MPPHKHNRNRNTTGFFLAGLLLLLGMSLVLGAPTGPEVLYNFTENVSPAAALEYTTAGGSFTTLVFNASMQTPRWKAYVGNVSGLLTLDDPLNNTIYDWSLTTIAGEIYASRAGNVDWPSLGCAANATIFAEQAFLNMSNSTPDSINRTFNNTIHRSFYIGTRLIANSSCRSIVTYVNGSKQPITEDAPFQEILMEDVSSTIVYSTLIEQDVQGFDNQTYDFQMIVPEDEYAGSPTPYYFWVELI